MSLSIADLMALGKRAMQDSAHARAISPGDLREAKAHQDEAQACFEAARAQGWDGDVRAHMLAVLNSPDCDFSPAAQFYAAVAAEEGR